MLTVRALCSTFALLVIISALGSGPSTAQTALSALTGAQILAKCQAAYDDISSYSCEITATVTGGISPPLIATANIQFIRPGQLTITGTTLFKTPYGLTTDGTTTSVTANGSTNKVQSTDYGIAAVTGIGGTAPTLVSALLLGSKMLNPFVAGQTVSNHVTIQNVNGVPCYEVDVLYPLKRAFWVNTQTFLLEQSATRVTMPNFGTFHYLQTVSDEQVNAAAPTPGNAPAGVPGNAPTGALGNALAPNASAQSPQLLVNGTAAPDFTVQDPSGNPVKLSDYRGKVVVLDFWATWCGPCQQSLPATNTLAATYSGQNIQFLAVDVADPVQTFESWLSQHKELSSLKFAIDTSPPASAAAATYGVSGIPTQYVIDPKGNIVNSFVGYDGETDGLAAAIKTVLASAN